MNLLTDIKLMPLAGINKQGHADLKADGIYVGEKEIQNI